MTDSMTGPGKTAPEQGPRSLLEQLRAEHADTLDKSSTTELEIPDLPSGSLPMALRVHALDHKVIARESTKVLKAKGDARAEQQLASSATLVYLATDAVLLGDKDDTAREEHDLFAPELLLALGLQGVKQALPVLQELFLHKDGAIIDFSEQITRFSGYKQRAADESFLG